VRSTQRPPWNDPVLDTAVSSLLTVVKAGGEVSRDDLRLLLPEDIRPQQTEQVLDWLRQRGVKLTAPAPLTQAKRRKPATTSTAAAAHSPYHAPLRERDDSLEDSLSNPLARTSKAQLLTRSEEVELAQVYQRSRQECFEWVTRTGSIVTILLRLATRVDNGEVSIWEVIRDEAGDPEANSREDEASARERLQRGVQQLRRLRRQIATDHAQLCSHATRTEKEAQKLARRIREARHTTVRLVRELGPAENPLVEAMDRICQIGRVLIRSQREVLTWEEKTGLTERTLRRQLLEARKAREAGRKIKAPGGLDAKQEQQLVRSLANVDRRVRALEEKVAMDRQQVVRALQRISLARRQMERIRDRFVATNQRLVYFWAQRYEAKGVPFQDLVQEGNLGLLRAVERYDPERGFRFSTYAVWWIRQAIARAVAAQSRTIRLPVHVQERLQNMRRVAQRMLVSKGRYPTPEELGRAVGLAADEVTELQLASRLPVSLSTPLGDDEDHVLEDRVPDPGAPSPSRTSEQSQLAGLISGYLDKLTPRQRFVVQLRFGLLDGEPRTLEAVGEELGVTRERVRQITEQVLERMRKWAKKDGLQP